MENKILYHIKLFQLISHNEIIITYLKICNKSKGFMCIKLTSFIVNKIKYFSAEVRNNLTELHWIVN